MNAQTESKILNDMLDRQTIHDLLLGYCRGVDRVDRNLIAATFHPDAQCEFGDLLLKGAEIPDAIAKAASGLDISTHMVGNVLIELHGDEARCETYYLSSGILDQDGAKQLRMRAGRYVDLLRRRDGQWKIADRVVVQDWCRYEDLADVPPGSGFRPGQQGTADPLYALLNR